MLCSPLVFPLGTIVAFASNSVAPSGYIHCNGAEISRTTYAALFAVISTTYGAGNGSSTFNLPQLADGRFIRGESGAGNYYGAGMPNISGAFTAGKMGRPSENVSYWGAFSVYDAGYAGSEGDSSYHTVGVDFYASRVNSLYGASSTVMPQSLSMKFYIKF